MRNVKPYLEFLHEKKLPYSQTAITVFDLDDTLVISKAKIKVCDTRSGHCFELTPEEFNEYERQPHHQLNFDDFKSLEIMKAGRLIDYYLKILADAYKMGRAVGIVTARDDQDMIYTWMKEHVGFHIARELIYAINDPKSGLKGSIAERKQQAFRKIIEKGYKKIQFFDDDMNNLKLVKQLQSEYDDIELSVFQAHPPKFR